MNPRTGGYNIPKRNESTSVKKNTSTKFGQGRIWSKVCTRLMHHFHSMSDNNFSQFYKSTAGQLCTNNRELCWAIFRKAKHEINALLENWCRLNLPSNLGFLSVDHNLPLWSWKQQDWPCRKQWTPQQKGPWKFETGSGCNAAVVSKKYNTKSSCHHCFFVLFPFIMEQSPTFQDCHTCSGFLLKYSRDASHPSPNTWQSWTFSLFAEPRFNKAKLRVLV